MERSLVLVEIIDEIIWGCGMKPTIHHRQNEKEQSRG
jgi:hypothetical protein